jgi:hypothetical protein
VGMGCGYGLWVWVGMGCGYGLCVNQVVCMSGCDLSNVGMADVSPWMCNNYSQRKL